ncbi:MAG TPA: carboxypeptidase-like regulatory domain-containing protein [Methylomirabilota bacterium]|nr:carboxypeptidase-like regulatory domain-containing protein [Methylomirabilota bacterium]
MSAAGRLLRNRYVIVLGSLALATAAWNAYVALHDDGVIAGHVVAPDGRPAAGATVTLYERTLTTLEPRGTATTAEDGRFLFTGQRLHHFVLEARQEGVGVAPRTAYRLYFRGQNVTLPAPLALH